jgi:hypothetical protein
MRLVSLSNHRHARGLPVGAKVQALVPGTDEPISVTDEKGAPLKKALVVRKIGLPGWVIEGEPVELVATWPGGSRMGASRALKGMPRPPSPLPVTGVRALTRLPRIRRPRDPRPVEGVHALVRLAGTSRPAVPREATGVRALTHMMLRNGVGLALPPDTIPEFEILTGDGTVVVTVNSRLGLTGGELDPDTALIPLGTGPVGADDVSPYFSPSAQSLLAWDPQCQLLAIVKP